MSMMACSATAMALAPAVDGDRHAGRAGPGQVEAVVADAQELDELSRGRRPGRVVERADEAHEIVGVAQGSSASRSVSTRRSSNPAGSIWRAMAEDVRLEVPVGWHQDDRIGHDLPGRDAAFRTSCSSVS